MLAVSWKCSGGDARRAESVAVAAHLKVAPCRHGQHVRPLGEGCTPQAGEHRDLRPQRSFVRYDAASAGACRIAVVALHSRACAFHRVHRQGGGVVLSLGSRFLVAALRAVQPRPDVARSRPPLPIAAGSCTNTGHRRTSSSRGATPEAADEAGKMGDEEVASGDDSTDTHTHTH